MQPEAISITRHVEEFLRLQAKLPAQLTLVPADSLGVIEVLQQTEPLLREIRAELGGLETLQIFDPRIRRAIVTIRREETSADWWKPCLAFLTLCLTGKDRDLENTNDFQLMLGERVREKLGCEATLLEKLKVLFSHGPKPGYGSTDQYYEDFIDVETDISAAAYTSKYYSPDEYVAELQELMATLNPDVMAKRRNEVGTAIISQHVPDVVKANLARARQCYVFGLPEATVVFCRAVIEGVLVELLKRRGVSAVWDLAGMIEWAKRKTYLSGDLPGHAHGIREKANDLLHDESVTITGEEAKDMLNQTREIIEAIFA